VVDDAAELAVLRDLVISVYYLPRGLKTSTYVPQAFSL
jgi:hypothetical protein